jgi:hypothetical protein
MNSIERLFGMAPDGGNGAPEFLLFALPIAGIVYTSADRVSASGRRCRQRQTVRTGERGR